MDFRLIGLIDKLLFLYFAEFQSNENFFEKRESVRIFRVLLLKRGVGKRNRAWGQLEEQGECWDDGALMM